MMNQSVLDLKILYRIRQGVVLVIAFLIPLFPKLLPPAIALLALLSLIIFIKQPKGTPGSWRNVVLWIPVCFYLLHLAGLLWSDNLKFGIKDVEIKLSILLLPILLISGMAKQKFPVNRIMNFFTIGCLINMILILIRAYIRYPVTGTNAFFYGELSWMFHPGYLSMYYTLALSWVLVRTINTQSPVRYLTLISAIVLLTIIITLLSSKVAMLVVLIIVIFFSFRTIRRKEFFGQHLLAIGVIPIVMVFTVLSILPYKNRFAEFTERIDQTIPQPTEQSAEQAAVGRAEPGSSAVRLMVWKISLAAIGENLPFGTGTGDIKDVLVEKYRESNADVLLRVEVNPHNQYLQTTLALGLPGLLLLILIIWIMVRAYLKSGDILVCCFVLIIALNAMVESILEVQAGVIFFAFMYSVLIDSNSDESPVS